MIRIGDVEIARIEESMLHESTDLFAAWNEAMLERYRGLLVPHCFDTEAGAFRVSIHSFLVRTPERIILVDTGAGNDKPRPASPRFDRQRTPFLDRLAAAGVTPENVDTVVCTHLHVDHIGWNTRLDGTRWVPTFPNARYYFARVEVETRDPRRGAAGRPPATHLPFVDSVRPILDGGLATLVAGDERLADGIDFVPVPGHAPGQFAVRVRAKGREVLLAADVMHQPVQVYEPDWNSKYCEDPELAARTRRRILDYCADRGCLLFTAHFGFPHGGRVVRRSAGYAFVPAGEDVNA